MKKLLILATVLLAACGGRPNDPHGFGYNETIENSRIADARLPERAKKEEEKNKISVFVPPSSIPTIINLAGDGRVSIMYNTHGTGMSPLTFGIKNPFTINAAIAPTSRIVRREDGFAQAMLTAPSREYWEIEAGKYAADNPGGGSVWSLNFLLNGENKETPFNSLLGFIDAKKNVANSREELNALFDGYLEKIEKDSGVEARRMQATTTHQIVLSQGGVIGSEKINGQDVEIRLQFSDFGYWRQETKIAHAGRTEDTFARVESFYGGLNGLKIDTAKITDLAPINFSGVAIGVLRVAPNGSHQDVFTSDTELRGQARLTFNPLAAAGSGNREILTLTFPKWYTLTFDDKSVGRTGSSENENIAITSGGTGNYTISYWGTSNTIFEAVGSFFYSGLNGGDLISLTGAFGVRVPPLVFTGNATGTLSVASSSSSTLTPGAISGEASLVLNPVAAAGTGDREQLKLLFAGLDNIVFSDKGLVSGASTGSYNASYSADMTNASGDFFAKGLNGNNGISLGGTFKVNR